MRYVILLLLICIGCKSESERRNEMAVKSAYASFRQVLILRKASEVGNFVSTNELALYSPEELLDIFDYIARSDTKLSEDAWVEKDKENPDDLWLFPTAPTTVGWKWVKESGAWKITITPRPVIRE